MLTVSNFATNVPFVNILYLLIMLSFLIPTSYFLGKNKVIRKEINVKWINRINFLLNIILIGLSFYILLNEGNFLLVLAVASIYLVTALSFYRVFFKNKYDYLIESVSISLLSPLFYSLPTYYLFILLFFKNLFYGTKIALRNKEVILPTIFFLIYSILSLINSLFLGSDLFLFISIILSLFYLL